MVYKHKLFDEKDSRYVSRRFILDSGRTEEYVGFIIMLLYFDLRTFSTRNVTPILKIHFYHFEFNWCLERFIL